MVGSRAATGVSPAGKNWNCWLNGSTRTRLPLVGALIRQTTENVAVGARAGRRVCGSARLRALPGRRVVNAAAGERIIRQGDEPGDLYVVVSGGVRLERAGVALAEVGPSELFGEVALYGGGRQAYDAVATVASTLLVIPAESAQAALVQ